MHFDLTDLRLFAAIAETGSITAGAERTGLALASASARIVGSASGWQRSAKKLSSAARSTSCVSSGKCTATISRMVSRSGKRM